MMTTGRKHRRYGIRPRESLTLERLRSEINDRVGGKREVYRWFLRTLRRLRELGFRRIAKGVYVKGPFKIVLRWNPFPDGSAMGMVRITGPSSAPRPKRISDYPGLKYIVLDKHGRVKRVPADRWDPKRGGKSHR